MLRKEQWDSDGYLSGVYILELPSHQEALYISKMRN